MDLEDLLSRVALAFGLFDVDAMTVSMARLVPQPLDRQAATVAILAGVASNTFTKVAIAALIGRGRFAIEIAAVALGCIVAGWLTMSLTVAVVDVE